MAKGDSKVPAGPATSPFTDLTTSSTYYKYAAYLQSKGIISSGTSLSTTNITRDRIAVILARAKAGSDAAVPAGPAKASFTDVPTTYWAYKYIEYLKAQGVISGYSDGTFRPTATVTRAEMAVFEVNDFNLQ